jgi:hypothetical protein
MGSWARRVSANRHRPATAGADGRHRYRRTEPTSPSPVPPPARPSSSPWVDHRATRSNQRCDFRIGRRGDSKEVHGINTSSSPIPTTCGWVACWLGQSQLGCRRHQFASLSLASLYLLGGAGLGSRFLELPLLLATRAPRPEWTLWTCAGRLAAGLVAARAERDGFGRPGRVRSASL